MSASRHPLRSRRKRRLAGAWIALLAVLYAALSPAFAAAALAERPAALARMLGLPHHAAAVEDEHAHHAHESQPTAPDDDAAHSAHGIYCSFCLNPGSTAALTAPPLTVDLAAPAAGAAALPPPQLHAAAVHPGFRSRAPPQHAPALS